MLDSRRGGERCVCEAGVVCSGGSSANGHANRYSVAVCHADGDGYATTYRHFYCDAYRNRDSYPGTDAHGNDDA